MTNGALWYCLDDVGAPAELDLGATHTAKLVADRRSLCAPGHAEFDENVLGVGVFASLSMTNRNDVNFACISTTPIHALVHVGDLPTCGLGVKLHRPMERIRER
jgi:hypothetical protein